METNKREGDLARRRELNNRGYLCAGDLRGWQGGLSNDETRKKITNILTGRQNESDTIFFNGRLSGKYDRLLAQAQFVVRNKVSAPFCELTETGCRGTKCPLSAVIELPTGRGKKENVAVCLEFKLMFNTREQAEGELTDEQFYGEMRKRMERPIQPCNGWGEGRPISKEERAAFNNKKSRR